MPKRARGKSPFRFFDNREKYLLFVTTCSEKWEIAARVDRELRHVQPHPPALKIFDAGMGDGTVLARVMRSLHQQFPTIPFLLVGKEISLEDVRLTIEKLPDRFFEHPQTVFVATNLYYYEAPGLMPKAPAMQGKLNWHEIALDGTTTYAFDRQIRELHPVLSACWRTRTSAKSGNPRYVQPTVLVIYRKDHRFALDRVIPRLGEADGQYDLVLASQPYQARLTAETKIRNVLAPLCEALAPGGRMLVIQSTGNDPGMEIIRKVWPDENPFRTPRRMLVEALKQAHRQGRPKYRCLIYPDHRSLFRYGLHTMPSEIADNIGTSTLLAAWNAAVYVAQIEDARLVPVLRDGAYLEATKKVVRRHGGLWFTNESFAVVRPRH